MKTVQKLRKSYLFLLLKGRIPAKGDFVQSLATPLVVATPFDKVGTGSVGLDDKLDATHIIVG